jgi:hypothetical protein
VPGCRPWSERRGGRRSTPAGGEGRGEKERGIGEEGRGGVEEWRRGGDGRGEERRRE